MGKKLDAEYQKSEVVDTNKTEEEIVRQIIEKSNKEYEDMKPSNKVQLKTVLIIAGVVVLIALIGKAIFNLGFATNKYNGSSGKLTNTIDMDKGN